MYVSKNGGTPKSSILIGFSLINHPFWDTPIFGNPHMSQSWVPFQTEIFSYAKKNTLECIDCHT